MKKNRLSLLHTISPKPYIIGLLFLSIILSLFFTVYKNASSPPCFNADEAAFGYNAYSILQTGADEYGNVLPLRLKSFGDYKMPLYSYLSIPFVGILGLNEMGVRSLNILIALLFPIAIFYLVKELFGKEEVGAIAALLISVSLGKGIVERQAHEALLAVFLITVASYFFVRFLKTESYKNAIFFIVPLTFSLFTYHSSRLFALFFFVFAFIYFFQKKKITKIRSFFVIIFVIALSLFLLTDIIYKPARVQNLLFINNSGFTMKVMELVGEAGNPYFYNKLTVGAQHVISQHMQYFSPQFLAINGDENYRFGYPGMSPLTPLEYIFIFIGMYYLFKNQERWRYLLIALFFISPLTAALSWAEASLTRPFFILIPALILSAYGIYNILLLAAKKGKLKLILIGLLFIESFFLFYSWNFYFNHYPKRAIVTRHWQCGYKELASYVKNNYDKFDTFYITIKHGEPYIFMLYYLQYPPSDYQKQASLTAPDEFGFGQVEKFDKFDFSVPSSAWKEKDVVIVGYPDDFNGITTIDKTKIKKITIGREDIFWIYEL